MRSAPNASLLSIVYKLSQFMDATVQYSEKPKKNFKNLTLSADAP